MTWIPTFEIGLWNAWLFMIVFPLQWLLVVVVPRHIAERAGHDPGILRDRQDRIMAHLTQGFWIGATLYSVFVPFRTGTLWLWIGLASFVAGLATLVSATLTVGGTLTDRPFTSGIYRYSRHPMYLSMILVYLGASIAAASWLFLLVTVVTVFLQRYQMLMEERFCVAKFGDAYREYLEKTPRWIGPPK